MRRVLTVVLLAALCFIPTSGFSDGLCPGQTKPFIPYAKETLSVGAAAVPFTVATYNTAGQSPVLATVTVEAAFVRVWSDGSTPTAAVGQLINTNVFWVCGYKAINQFKAIATSGAASLSVEYSK